MSKRYIACVALALSLMAGPFAGWAQSPEDALRFARRAPAFSARMAGMAGAGIAGVPDLSALIYNPAALAYASSHVTGSIGLLATTDEAFYLGDPESQTIYDTGLHGIGYAYKVPTERGSLVVGASVNRLQSYERLREYGGLNPVLPAGANFYPEFVDPATPVQQQGEVALGGAKYAFSAGGAVEMWQGVMVGVALRVPFGRYTAFDRLDEEYLNAGGDHLERYASIETLNAEFAGAGLSAGLATQIAFGLQFGLTLETPTYLSVSEDFETEYYALFADNYVDEEEITGAFDYNVVTPWRLGAGLAYELGSLSIAGGAVFIDWSQLSFRGESDIAYLQEQNQLIRDNLQPVVQTRVGASYAFDGLTLRGGLANMPDAFRTGFETASGERGDAARRYISAGLSFRLAPQLWMDASWQQQSFNDIYTLYAPEDVVRDDVESNRYLVGLRYRW